LSRDAVLVVQVLALFCAGDQPWRPGAEHEQPALPGSAGRVRPGDIMIDRVLPRPARVAAGQGDAAHKRMGQDVAGGGDGA
jgi:hypothetical protein